MNTLFFIIVSRNKRETCSLTSWWGKYKQRDIALFLHYSGHSVMSPLVKRKKRRIHYKTANLLLFHFHCWSNGVNIFWTVIQLLFLFLSTHSLHRKYKTAICNTKKSLCHFSTVQIFIFVLSLTTLSFTKKESKNNIICWITKLNLEQNEVVGSWTMDHGGVHSSFDYLKYSMKNKMLYYILLYYDITYMYYGACILHGYIYK